VTFIVHRDGGTMVKYILKRLLVSLWHYG